MLARCLLLFTVTACSDAPAAPVPSPRDSIAESPAAPGSTALPRAYAASVEALHAERDQLAQQLVSASKPADVIAKARTTLLKGLTDDLLPAWTGTPWAMQGTATQPGEAPIACGYFVSTLLRDAGLSLPRVEFGQAAALRIQNATTPRGVKVHTFFSIPPAKLAKRIAALGDGLYIIGLNVHVGFVVVRDGDVRFVHSSYTGDRVVTNEPLATAAAIANSQPRATSSRSCSRPTHRFANGSRARPTPCQRRRAVPDPSRPYERPYYTKLAKLPRAMLSFQSPSDLPSHVPASSSWT